MLSAIILTPLLHRTKNIPKGGWFGPPLDTCRLAGGDEQSAKAE